MSPSAIPGDCTFSLALVQRPGPLSPNIQQMAFSALRGHWGYLGDCGKTTGRVLVEGCFPTSMDEMAALEGLCQKCTEFGCRAELRIGDPRGSIIEMFVLGN